MHGKVHVSVHVCMNDYLWCTIVFADMLLGARKMCTKIFNSSSPVCTLFFISSEKQALWAFFTTGNYPHQHAIASVFVKSVNLSFLIEVKSGIINNISSANMSNFFAAVEVHKEGKRSGLVVSTVNCYILQIFQTVLITTFTS